MNALVRKEVRQVLPMWIVAMLLAVAPAWLIPMAIFLDGDNARAIAFGSLCLGILLVSLNTFGQEFSSGTFQQLLAQPVLRRRIWRVKLGTLGLGLLLVLASFLVSYGCRISRLEEISTLGFLVFFSLAVGCALASGALWTMLLFRQIAVGFWLTIFMPIVFSFSTLVVLEKVFNVAPPLPPWSQCVTLAVYAAGGLVWARRLFLRAQDVPWTGGNIVLPDWLRWRTADGSRGEMRGIGLPVMALIRKEIQLQQVGLLAGGGSLLLQCTLLPFTASSVHTETQDRILLVITIGWAALWSALPFLLGTVPVAEERKQGTLESALTLPARRSSQVAVKLGVALCLGLLLGAVLPWLIAGLGFQFGLRSGPFTTAFDLDGLKALAILMVCIISICFYASTLSRTTLQAMGVAILFVLLLGSLFFFAPGMTQPLGHPSWSWISWKLNALVGIPALTLCFLVLARWNFRQLLIGRGDWIRNVVMWLLTVALIFTSTSAIYHRCWEYFTPLEPAHGPWQLFGSVRPQIGFSGQKLFVLLPDGRLWTSKHSREQYLYAGGGVRNGEAVQYPVYCPVPVDGEFIGGSNWVKLATSWGRAYAIQSDGTLWRIPVRPGRPESTDSQPVREGIDTDWSDVAAGANFFLVLKRDGTVWGWGDNNSGQLGPGPRAITNFLVRVGTNSDWAAVFANLGTSVGVKRDGSVWKWGDLLNGPHGRKGWKSGAYPEPVRWDMSGADWVKVADHGSSMLALQRDGYLMWEWDVPDKSTGNARRPQSSACRDFSENNHWLLIVKTDGTLIRHDWMSEWNGFGWGSMDQPSKKSDWLAVKASWSDPWVALASDGTLCAWWEGDPGEYAMGRMWLGPSRRPLWSLNILARSK